MRILIACEYSAIERTAFEQKGHDVWSCDLEDTEVPGNHIKGDVLEILNDGWDMLIGHPPCTYLANSGARWNQHRRDLQDEAVEFVQALMDAPITHIAIENPIGVLSSRIRPPDQIIQPWQFGHGETKATCLWLKNLPTLKPTDIVPGREHRIHRMSPGPDRQKERSRSYTGIAAAMADQWSRPLFVQKSLYSWPADRAVARML